MTPRIALLLIGDGRDTLRHATMLSLYDHLAGAPIAFVVEVDDRQHRLGFGGAIREGWRNLRALDNFDYVFHVEEDWRFDREVRIDRMIDLLCADPRIAQVALRRGPVNAQERRAGGVIEQWPEEYADGNLFLPYERDPDGWPFLRHELFWTTNPSVYSRRLIDTFDWPLTDGSERAFTELMLQHGHTFAYWGARSDAPWITHMGERARGARGY